MRKTTATSTSETQSGCNERRHLDWSAGLCGDGWSQRSSRSAEHKGWPSPAVLQSRVISTSNSNAFASQHFWNLSHRRAFPRVSCPRSPHYRFDGSRPFVLNERAFVGVAPNLSCKRLHSVELKWSNSCVHLPKENAKRINVARWVVRLFHSDLWKNVSVILSQQKQVSSLPHALTRSHVPRRTSLPS